MSDTQVLLNKIATLRQRLEQAQGLVPTEGRGEERATLPLVHSLLPANEVPNHIKQLERQVTSGAWYHKLLDDSLRQLTESDTTGDQEMVLPRQLTARTRRLLGVGQELLMQLRQLANEFELAPVLVHPLSGLPDETDPLAVRFRETLAMLDTALRMIQAYPDAPSAQLRLCEGLEVTLHEVSERITHLQALLVQRRRETSRLDSFTELLAHLESGKSLDVQPFIALADALLAEAHQGAPLRFYQAAPEQPARFIASHSLVVAQVMARLIKHEPDLRHQPMEPVLAALVHDVGMLRIPEAILTHRGPLTDSERRTVESHTRSGAELATRLLPSGAWLAEATAGHHERLDGTGYPGGLREMQITPLVSLLAVCDVYAALCAPRPHRAALDSRAALTDTLLLAEKGALDKQHAERLLYLSFYPVGSVVELADGAIGMVVATHMSRRDLNSPARPVVALLTDEQGKPLPVPQHVDLAQWDNRSIVRALQPAQRRQALGLRYPEFL